MSAKWEYLGAAGRDDMFAVLQPDKDHFLLEVLDCQTWEPAYRNWGRLSENPHLHVPNWTWKVRILRLFSPRYWRAMRKLREMNRLLAEPEKEDGK